MYSLWNCKLIWFLEADILYDNKLYNFYGSAKTWDEAQASCEEAQGTLAYFETESAFDAVIQKLLEKFRDEGNIHHMKDMERHW